MIRIGWYGHFDKLYWRIKESILTRKLVKKWGLKLKDSTFHLIRFQEGIIRVEKENKFDEHHSITIFGRTLIKLPMVKLISIEKSKIFLLEQDRESLVYKRLVEVDANTQKKKVLFEEKEWPISLSAFLSFDGKQIILNRIGTESLSLYSYDLITRSINLLHHSNQMFAYADHVKNRFIICSNLEGEKENIYQKKDKDLNWNILYEMGENEELIDCNVIGRNGELSLVVYNSNRNINECLVVNQRAREITRIELESLLSTVTVEIQDSDILIEETCLLEKKKSVFDGRTGRKKEFKSSLLNQKTKQTVRTHLTKSGIPITTVIPPDCKSILCEVYGCYGETQRSFFLNDCWMNEAIESGLGYAYFHVRGGREKGWKWYLEGRGKLKFNSITDTIDCIEYIKQLYPNTKIILYGFSAGAFVVESCYRMFPLLPIDSVILDRGLLEFEEYKKEYKRIPLSNQDEEEFDLDASGSTVIPSSFPISTTSILIICMLNDKRIPFKYSWNWFLKARKNNNNSRLQLNYTNGHNFDQENELKIHQLKILSFILNTSSRQSRKIITKIDKFRW